MVGFSQLLCVWAVTRAGRGGAGQAGPRVARRPGPCVHCGRGRVGSSTVGAAVRAACSRAADAVQTEPVRRHAARRGAVLAPARQPAHRRPVGRPPAGLPARPTPAGRLAFSRLYPSLTGLHSTVILQLPAPSVLIYFTPLFD